MRLCCGHGKKLEGETRIRISPGGKLAVYAHTPMYILYSVYINIIYYYYRHHHYVHENGYVYTATERGEKKTYNG